MTEEGGRGREHHLYHLYRVTTGLAAVRINDLCDQFSDVAVLTDEETVLPKPCRVSVEGFARAVVGMAGGGDTTAFLFGYPGDGVKWHSENFQNIAWQRMRSFLVAYG
jgi:hypothetical protein